MSLLTRKPKRLNPVVEKGGKVFIGFLTPATANILHMAVGISGEAGELLDAVKKAAIYNKELDRENVIEELGDLEFYMQGLRYELGINRAEVIAYNMEKLSKRYTSGYYSNKAAQDRADKMPEGLVIDDTNECEGCQ